MSNTNTFIIIRAKIARHNDKYLLRAIKHVEQGPMSPELKGKLKKYHKVVDPGAINREQYNWFDPGQLEKTTIYLPTPEMICELWLKFFLTSYTLDLSVLLESTNQNMQTQLYGNGTDILVDKIPIDNKCLCSFTDKKGPVRAKKHGDMYDVRDYECYVMETGDDTFMRDIIISRGVDQGSTTTMVCNNKGYSVLPGRRLEIRGDPIPVLLNLFGELLILQEEFEVARRGLTLDAIFAQILGEGEDEEVSYDVVASDETLLKIDTELDTKMDRKFQKWAVAMSEGGDNEAEDEDNEEAGEEVDDNEEVEEVEEVEDTGDTGDTEDTGEAGNDTDALEITVKLSNKRKVRIVDFRTARAVIAELLYSPPDIAELPFDSSDEALYAIAEDGRQVLYKTVDTYTVFISYLLNREHREQFFANNRLQWLWGTLWSDEAVANAIQEALESAKKGSADLETIYNILELEPTLRGDFTKHLVCALGFLHMPAVPTL